MEARTQNKKENEIMIYWEMGLVGALGWIHGYTGTQGSGRMYHMWQGLGFAFRHCDGALSPWSVGGVFVFFDQERRHDGQEEGEIGVYDHESTFTAESGS